MHGFIQLMAVIMQSNLLPYYIQHCHNTDNQNQNLDLQKTTHISPWWVSCGVFIVRIWEEINS